MTFKEIDTILKSHKEKSKIYYRRKQQLAALWLEMQGLNAVRFDKVSVQGGEKSTRLDDLIDKEIELSKIVQDALFEKSKAYENAMRLIDLANNNFNDADILSEIYLLEKSYSAVSKKYGYDKQALWNKVHKAKSQLVKTTEKKGLKYIDFVD